ncbi:DUF1990 family protein [Protaetiibacter intestinalis]|uniref:DUF1990 domain-containing protein n=1 Tax=Protaetiibacter intestinalis TaxID=2419774 RepID=A0A387BEG4_9MICO|nr:DUF1990 domain-containing protein [Protaetiibacter intestinalis]AYF96870.1 DUF1990 domain-containing protein [Protaetiibacter intestinalis]
MDAVSTESLTYDTLGMARPGAAVPRGFRGRTQRIRLGEGPALWERAVAVVSGWRIKTAIGFTVEPDDAVATLGRDYDTEYRSGRIRQFEPVRVVWIADGADRRGFGYGTRLGHPVTGEECFLVERDADGAVWLVVRTVSRVSGGRWRWLWLGVRVGIGVFQRRYAESAVRLITGGEELPGMRRMRRQLVGDGASDVEGIARLGYGMNPERGPFDAPPAEPVELDDASLPWELRDPEDDTNSAR